jgi:type III restriction enzyme
MLDLRAYQRQCLDELGAYLRVVGQHGAKAAFALRTERPYREVPHLPGLPYVCIRVPTGGGKTLMACHAVGIAAREYLQRGQAVVLWLVPSNAIREQTLKALRDRRHPYREQIDADCGGRVTVMDLREALSVQRGPLDGDTCIIVSTLAALRVEDTEGRKIYEQAGALEHHFSGLPEAATQGLERYEPGGAVIPSLANVLRMHKPLVIMDGNTSPVCRDFVLKGAVWHAGCGLSRHAIGSEQRSSRPSVD